MNIIPKILNKFHFSFLDQSKPEKFGRISYSQEGEDVLLWRILDAYHNIPGTYVEVGCNHPWKCSNTAFFYKKGWSGVTIDPNPDFAALFQNERPRDVFLNVGIGERECHLIYHRFKQSLLNTFVEKQAEITRCSGVEQIDSIKVKVCKLGEVLAEIWPEGRKIDLLSIDAEGMDSEIIKGNDFQLFPASFVIAELDSLILDDRGKDEDVIGLLRERGYLFISKLWKSALFIHEEKAREISIL